MDNEYVTPEDRVKKIREEYKKKFIEEICNHNKEVAEYRKKYEEEHEKQLDNIYETVSLRVDNKELKAQIEKMKVCGNCKYCIIEGVPYCEVKKKDVCNRPCDNWELMD